MPQYREIDRGPSPINNLVRQLGSGVSEGLSARREQDALDRILSKTDQNNSDEDVIKNIFSESSLDFGKKEKLSNVVSEVRKRARDISQMQQLRLARDSISKEYSRRIKEIDEQLKSGFFQKGEKPQLLEMRRKLIDERNNILGNFSRQDNQQKSEIKKSKFDKTNPLHKKRADEILESVGGDEDKAAQILDLEFE